MVKPEWGSKRHCQHCGARFYDLHRSPIICPKCGTENEPDGPRVRRAAPAEEERRRRKAVPAEVAVADEAELPVDEDALEDLDAAEEEEEGVLEDASELGEDEDDVAEVIENLDENGEEER